MKLNHINLVVSNIPEAIHLFETYFNFKCTGIKGDHVIAILKGANDFTLVLMSGKNNVAIYPDAFHIGFMQDTKEQVSEIYRQLKDGGISVGEEPKKIRDSFGFYFKFDNLMIEVGHYIGIL
ncbi:MAG: VOC family protein [Ginsengibacter sp.]